MAHVANPQKAQQGEWRKSPENTLQQKAFKHCGEGVPEEADLFKLGWSNGEVIVLYLICKDCEKKEHHIAEVSQTSFSYIFINSLMILTVLKAPESPWKKILINTSHISKQSIIAEILGRSTGNHHGTIY